jgi:hypothetical protein
MRYVLGLIFHPRRLWLVLTVDRHNEGVNTGRWYFWRQLHTELMDRHDRALLGGASEDYLRGLSDAIEVLNK